VKSSIRNSAPPARFFSLSGPLCLTIVAGCALALAPAVAGGQSGPGTLVSRAELTAIMERAEVASHQGDAGARSKNAAIAMATRQRLRDGDFQVGDRVVVTVISDSVRVDTLAVRAGRYLELPNNIRVPVVGTLRSELRPLVTTEVLKYIKAQQVDVTPLMRLGVLGEVAHPGYFALASDIPLTDAIMAAGGPTTTADIENVMIRRASREYRSSEETRQAIARGMTLDQFGLNPGDELVIPRHRDISSGPWLTLLGAAATLLTIVVALRQ